MNNRLGNLAAGAMVLLAASLAHAQLFTMTKEQLTALTAQNPFDRFPDGRPKVPDALIERARGMSAEEAWAVFQRDANRTFRNQYEDGFQVLHPGKKMVGRAFTVQFMPARPDIESVVNSQVQAKGIPRLHNQTAI